MKIMENNRRMIITLREEKGISLLTAILILLLLSTLGLVLGSLVIVESQISVNHLYSTQAFYIAEAGIERAVRAILDDTQITQTLNPAANGYCVTPCLDGYMATGSGGSNYVYALFYGGTSPGNPTDYTITNRYCTLGTTIGANVQVYDFQQRYNLAGTEIRVMEIGIRARKSSSGGTNPIIQLRYSLNGYSGPWTNVGGPLTIMNTAWDMPIFTTIPVTPSWADLMAGGGGNFRIQAYRTNAGNRSVYIDYLCIRITLKNDAVTEPWYTSFKDATGAPITVNLPVANGVVASLPIDDEAGKVHLNYATHSQLRYLMVECGIADATANTLASNITSYRSSNWFDTVEEIKQVPGMTQAYYELIKDYITVYSWVNSNVQRPTGNRAPININTAPLPVLKAIFDPILGGTDSATLANAIITRRLATPFSSMFSSNPADTSFSFARFLDTQTTYLSASEIAAIRENCDASYYNTTQTTSWTGDDVTTTEFCYYSTTYSSIATGKVENSTRQIKRVFRDNGSFNISALWGPTLNYWREIIP